MSGIAYDAGIAAFHEYVSQKETELADKPWRAGGRASKKYPEKENRDWWMAEGPSMVHNWYNWRMTNPNIDVWTTPDGQPAVELGVNVPLPGGVILKAYIDRIMVDTNTGETIIVDLKTGQPPKSGLQLAVYRLALQQQFGIAPQFGAYWMARGGTLDTVYDLTFYGDDMVARWMRDVKKSIDQELYVPNMTMMCNSCGVKESCYAYSGNMEHAPDFRSDLGGNDAGS